MTSTEYTSNQRSTSQSVFTGHINYYPNKLDSKPPSRFQSFFNPNPLNNFIFNSNIQNKNFQYPQQFSSFYSNKSEQDNELYPKPLFPILNRSRRPSFFGFPTRDISQEKSKFQSKFSNNFGMEGKKFKFESKNFILNFDEPPNGQEKEKVKNEIIFESKNEKKNNNNQIILKNNIIISDNNNFSYNENCKIERNMNLNLSTATNNNMGTKFFTNHNYGYKCSCSKTQCNRKYCECYNSGNYCIDCNCKNCKNQPPENTYSNKRPTEIVSKMKKSKEICTCTKSGCNKNYCECYKSGNKCTSLCRCIGCENTEDNIKSKNKFDYECCRANSIYIFKNKIYIENLKGGDDQDRDRDISMLDTYENKNEKLVNKKRKRNEKKNCEELNVKKIKKYKKDDNILFNDSLFDENGKVILRHINMLHY